MKSILDTATRDGVIARIQSLPEASAAQWGTMTLYQMLKHFTLREEMALGKTRYKQALIGRIFGKLALKGMMKDETSIKRKMPTVQEMIVVDAGDASTKKAAWVALLEEYAQFSNPHFIHPFFGRMTEEQIGRMAYKHTDHHLRQFGA